MRPKAQFLWRKPVKSLGNIRGYRLSSFRSVKNPSNSIRYNCHKICNWSRRPKTILKIWWKRSHFSKWSTNLTFTSFSKFFAQHRKKNNKVAVHCRPLHNVLKYRIHRGEFLTILKTQSLKHVLKRRPNSYKSSGLQFFRSIIGIYLGSDTLEESRLVTTFYTNLVVTGTLHTFKLVLEKNR